jgi:hypothetical protein
MSNQIVRPLVSGTVAMLFGWLATTTSAISQNGACHLVADDRNPSEKILRCGDDLVVRATPGTRYHPVDQRGNEPPKALQLDTGALMIEFHPNNMQKDFQILTPQAVAAVRGTKWVVDVSGARTSTLVISGEVAVVGLRADKTVVLKPGEGADISAGTDSFAAKRWPEERVRALLARFGE